MGEGHWRAAEWIADAATVCFIHANSIVLCVVLFAIIMLEWGKLAFIQSLKLRNHTVQFVRGSLRLCAKHVRNSSGG